jgi:membrane-associated protease RseP (regulator of RpoE activity)
MRRRSLAVVMILILAASGGQAQTVAPPSEEKGTYLGVLISPVPEVLYDQLPELPRDQGVVVAHVLPDSPAAVAGLRRHDILLVYGDEKVRDCEHFGRLIRDDKPDRKVKLELVRAGRRLSAEATLTLGPVLKIAQANRSGSGGNSDVVPGRAKGGSSPSVSVAATPLDGGKVKVTIEYYVEGTGRLRTLNCEGTPTEIDAEVQGLPTKVKDLALVALQRIRDLEIQQKDQKTPAASSPSRRQR